jgi:hypothetical protein
MITVLKKSQRRGSHIVPRTLQAVIRCLLLAIAGALATSLLVHLSLISQKQIYNSSSAEAFFIVTKPEVLLENKGGRLPAAQPSRPENTISGVWNQGALSAAQVFASCIKIPGSTLVLSSAVLYKGKFYCGNDNSKRPQALPVELQLRTTWHSGYKNIPAL